MNVNDSRWKGEGGGVRDMNEVRGQDKELIKIHESRARRRDMVFS
jgi:hypothetical protein